MLSHEIESQSSYTHKVDWALVSEELSRFPKLIIFKISNLFNVPMRLCFFLNVVVFSLLRQNTIMLIVLYITISLVLDSCSTVVEKSPWNGKKQRK